jgi:hypothetical protein
MIRNSVSVGKKLQAIRGLAAASAAALVAGAILSVAAIHAGAQEPGAASSDLARLVGNWSGQTQNDGALTVTISEDRILGFQFTGGEKDHGYGTFRLQSPDRLLYTPLNETETQHWTYGFDSAGRLKLKMEEDDPKDVEEYTLSRVKP